MPLVFFLLFLTVAQIIFSRGVVLVCLIFVN